MAIFAKSNIGFSDLSTESIQATDICQHLQCLFNCRQGSLSQLPDYGLPEIQALLSCSRQPLLGLVDAMRQAINRYEPRLHQVNIEQDKIQPCQSQLALCISGCASFQKPLRFLTQIRNGSAIVVSVLNMEETL